MIYYSKYFSVAAIISITVIVNVSNVYCENNDHLSSKEIKPESIHNELDWFELKKEKNALSRNVIIDGFLSLEGIKDAPLIKLWETEEAMKHKRVFRSLSVNSENAMEIIGPQLGWTEEGWGVLHGAFVHITGTLIRAEEGLEFVNLGEMIHIHEIAVYSNGQLLHTIVRK
jgi:hypothetical protein